MTNIVKSITKRSKKGTEKKVLRAMLYLNTLWIATR
jgi:hypothetical protein